MTCPRSEDIIRQVRAECGLRTMLAFSRGKDSIAAALAILPHFDEVVPYYLYDIPGLTFVEESLDHYERTLFGGRRILRFPHPNVMGHLRSYTLQSPAHAAVLCTADLPKMVFKDAHEWVRESADLPDNVLAASGVRAADSPIRRLQFTSHGAISRNSGHYYPVWDWNKARLIEAIDKAGCGLPEDYLWFGRSWDGLDLRFVYPLKKHRPEDFKKVVEWFPLVEADIWRYERWGAV